MSRLATLLRLGALGLIGLSALAAQAQTVPAPAPPPKPTTSYSYGLLDTDFTYLDADSAFVYAFDAGSQAFMISGDDGYLLVSYGTQDADSSAFAPSYSMIQAQMGLGGQSYLFNHFMGLPVRGFLPTQLQLGYRYLAPGKEKFAALGPDKIEALHLASAGLALGVGADARIPKLVPILEDRLAARGMLLVGAGATTNVMTEFDELGLTGTRELHLEVRLERVLGNQTGVTLGYVYRKQNWGRRAPENVQDVLDALLEPGELTQKTSHHLIRLGINF